MERKIVTPETMTASVNGLSGQERTALRTAIMPSQVGKQGMVLSTDGNTVDWAPPATGGGSGSVTSINVSGGSTGLTAVGGPVTNSGTITLGGTLSVANGGTGATSSAGALTALGAQPALVSGVSIKTINGTSILGSGDMTISGGGTATGLTAGSSSTGYINYSGLSATAGQWNGGTALPTDITRLTYNGRLVANSSIFKDGATAIGTNATLGVAPSEGATSAYAVMNWDNSAVSSNIGSIGAGTTTNIMAGGSHLNGNPVIQVKSNKATALYDFQVNGTLYSSGGMRVISPNWPTIILQPTNTTTPTDSAVFNYDVAAKVSYLGTSGVGTRTAITAGGTGPLNPVIIVDATSVQVAAAAPLLVGYQGSMGDTYKLQVNSQIFATSGTIATSDSRYKHRVEPITGALDLVNALSPVSFEWKPHPVHNFPDGRVVGFIAQDVQSVLEGTGYGSSIVKTNQCQMPDGTTEEFMGIAEGNLIALLSSAVKELTEKNSMLEDRLAALESKIA